MEDTGGLRVLVVEDDEALRPLFIRAFEAAGYHVSAAGTLAEARAHLGTETFDALVLDEGLPDGRGNALLDDLPADRPRVMLIGGALGPIHDDRSDDSLQKPFPLDRLVQAVGELVSRPR